MKITVATFEYDALGRRIEKVDAIANTKTCYYYDDQRIALQTSVPSGGSETDEKYFIFGNYIDEVLVMRNLTGTPADYYYAHDHLYSPVALFESDGDVVERYEYDVYGAVRILTSGFGLLTSSQYGNPYYFTGRELDSLDGNTLKLMYYRARYYDLVTGRFLQRDPMQYIDGMNLYEYVGSCPIMHLDSRGLSHKNGCSCVGRTSGTQYYQRIWREITFQCAVVGGDPINTNDVIKLILRYILKYGGARIPFGGTSEVDLGQPAVLVIINTHEQNTVRDCCSSKITITDEYTEDLQLVFDQNFKRQLDGIIVRKGLVLERENADKQCSKIIQGMPPIRPFDETCWVK